MNTLAHGLSFADLEFQGLPRIVATAVAQGRDGLAIIDPGPSSTLPVLRRHLAALGASVGDITTLLITHIHLDHAGATGTLLRENPRIRVVVHEVGAPHMVDPSRLLASAGRLYGADMERLWGAVQPVPASSITTVVGGEGLTVGGRPWLVAYTPGHASHHVSYFSPESGIAFVGDTGGVQVRPGGFVLPPTPPPDIDLAQWTASLTRIAAWHPQSLFMTHFGPTHAVDAHLAELQDHLQLVERLARQALVTSEEEPAREAWFVAEVRRELARRMGEADLRAYDVAGRFDLNWRGMVRFLTRRR